MYAYLTRYVFIHNQVVGYSCYLLVITSKLWFYFVAKILLKQIFDYLENKEYLEAFKYDFWCSKILLRTYIVPNKYVCMYVCT